MRKVIYKSFGDESVLELLEQDLPSIQETQLLIRVKAVSINPLDSKIFRGEMKLMSGTKFPKSVGIDFSGIVEKAGNAVKRFKTGDAVFGILDVFKGGALTDYITVNESDIALKPENISFEQAATLPVTGLAALQIIDQLAAVSKNQEVLINGATGGVGMFAVQIAKKRGATVTAVVSTQGMALAKEWGADIVIDYTKQDITSNRQRYDIIIDLSDKLPFKAARKLMKAKGFFINTVPAPAALIYSFIHNLYSSQKFKILILKPTMKGLDDLANLAKEGLAILIDKVYPITDVRRAYRETSQGKLKGKSIIVLD